MTSCATPPVPVSCETEPVERREVRLFHRDPAQRSPAGGTGPGSAAGSDHRGADPDEGAGAGESGAQASRRDPPQSVSFFRPGGARPPTQVMVTFIDDHQDAYWIEPTLEQRFTRIEVIENGE